MKPQRGRAETRTQGKGMEEEERRRWDGADAKGERGVRGGRRRRDEGGHGAVDGREVKKEDNPPKNARQTIAIVKCPPDHTPKMKYKGN